MPHYVNPTLAHNLRTSANRSIMVIPMTSRNAAFVEHVVTGIYAHRKHEKKLFVTISRNALTRVLGGQRLGSAQKEEMRRICDKIGIGFAELPDRLLFFDLEQAESLSVKADAQEKQIKQAIDHFVRLNDEAAAEDWKTYSFPKIA
jgi:hypothetical protein